MDWHQNPEFQGHLTTVFETLRRETAFFLLLNVPLVCHGLGSLFILWFSRGTHLPSLLPKAVVVKHTCIAVQISRAKRHNYFPDWQTCLQWSSPSAEKTSATTAPIFFEAKVQQQTHKIGFTSSSQRLRAIFIILVFLRLSQCGFLLFPR